MPVAFIARLVDICAGSPFRLRGRSRPSAHPQKYSVNPNGWLKWPTRGRVRAARKSTQMPIEFVGRKPRAGSLPDPSGRQGRAGRRRARTRRARLGARPTASTARPARVLVLPGPTARWPAPCSALGKATTSFGALGAGALATALPEGDWHFAGAPGRSRRLPRSASCSAAMSSPATARSRASELRFALPAGADAARVERDRRRRLPGARPHQHADQRHGAGRARGRPCGTLAAKHKAKVSVIDGRRSPGSRIFR